jgi:hypothetical protein
LISPHGEFCYEGALAAAAPSSIPVPVVKKSAFAFLLSVVFAWTGLTSAGFAVPAANINYTVINTDGPSAAAPLTRVDWQGPLSLPPGFRNHCVYHMFRGRYYCENHCGMHYQFFFCQPGSFGCCHVGHGYCDWDGMLRCAP